MRSDFLLKQDRITYEQAKQCVEFVAKQLQEVMLRAVETLVVGVDQIITGKELRQVMVKSFHEYLPDTAGHDKHNISLGAVLDGFVKLKEEPGVLEQDEPLKPIEEAIRKHYAAGADGAPDTSMLETRVDKLHEAYAEVLQRRTTKKGRIKEWLCVIREGNDSFRKVYDNIWQQV